MRVGSDRPKPPNFGDSALIRWLKLNGTHVSLARQLARCHRNPGAEIPARRGGAGDLAADEATCGPRSGRNVRQPDLCSPIRSLATRRVGGRWPAKNGLPRPSATGGGRADLINQTRVGQASRQIGSGDFNLPNQQRRTRRQLPLRLRQIVLSHAKTIFGEQGSAQISGARHCWFFGPLQIMTPAIFLQAR